MINEKKLGLEKKYGISVFFPCYNDTATIEKMVLDAIAILKKITDDFEVIVVDDASPDNAGAIAGALAKKYKQVKVIHHKKNLGYGGALKSGFANSTKELVFYTDGDGQYDARELLKLLPFIEKFDVINGYKTRRADSIDRIVLGRMYHYLASFLFGLKIRDVDCDFRLMKRKVVDSIHLESNEGVICVELVKKIQDAGFSIKEVPVSHYPRVSGTSQFFRPKRVVKSLIAMLLLWWKIIARKRLGFKDRT